MHLNAPMAPVGASGEASEGSEVTPAATQCVGGSPPLLLLQGKQHNAKTLLLAFPFLSLSLICILHVTAYFKGVLLGCNTQDDTARAEQDSVHSDGNDAEEDDRQKVYPAG